MSKFCTKCGEDDWVPNGSSRSGTPMSRCRVCRDKYQKENKVSSLVRVLRTYNITEDSYIHLLEKANHSCMICLVPEERLSRGLVVDHDHDTGKVRGVLCDKCNLGIGHLNDDKELVNKAYHYLNDTGG